MKPASVRTLYLIPHAHTDIGYTHDPLITWELHNRFLDRAIQLCDTTQNAPHAERFHWQVEVFATLEHWWRHRRTEAHQQLLHCIERGQIDIGARRFNGTFLLDEHDMDWEVAQLATFEQDQQIHLPTAIQNDVNGFPVKLMDRLAERGTDQLMIGLNTTMGVCPLQRPCAFWWSLPSGRRVLVWHGLIYNLLRQFLHLNKLAENLLTVLPRLLQILPEDYPYDFLALSATMNDNVGPFASLPQQIAQFNAKRDHHGIEVKLTTASNFMAMLREQHSDSLPSYQGEWPDAWAFGQAAFPQALAAMRRAQRRLALVEGLRDRNWAKTDDHGITLDTARTLISLAAEHTYCSHSSSSSHHDSPDAQRQWAQTSANFWQAESASMVVLRDHLALLASTQTDQAITGPSVLAVNPSPNPCRFEARGQRSVWEYFAMPEHPEHLMQFDREPTMQGVKKQPDLTADIKIKPESFDIRLLEPATAKPSLSDQKTLQFNVCTDAPGLSELKLPEDNHNYLRTDRLLPGASIMLERLPEGKAFQASSDPELRDPTDTPWQQDVRLERRAMTTPTATMELSTRDEQGWRQIFNCDEVEAVDYLLPAMQPDVLEITVGLRLADMTNYRAIYLTIPLNLESQSQGKSEDQLFYYVDSCGHWLDAGRDQLPGSVTSHYEAGLGVAAQCGDRAVLVVARDTALWQLGGLTFGPPTPDLNRSQPCLTAWLYNNYWFCNFPAASPGYVELKFLIEPLKQSQPVSRDQLVTLAESFNDDYRWHPVMPEGLK